MKEIGVVMNLSELGVKEADIEKLTELTLPMNGGYKPLEKSEIAEIFRESL